ncbi:pyruvate kinase isozyme A, chloroplastic-like [Carica papaya]|uniref:pyruvate kinase isozyme A, chloroplastic-like n=1 Tax=Carica papaya TaxID=3649 RepID=UPI000B8D1B0A|nr:pyruvate kinase isozyme A, chloroplastic-like [Carica papaya]
MCDRTREWHEAVIERVRRLNEENCFGVAVITGMKRSEIRMGDLNGFASAKVEIFRVLSRRMVKYGRSVFAQLIHIVLKCSVWPDGGS